MTQHADPRVTIVIPNYNGRHHLERLLPGIADQTRGDYEVIIVDDRSPDRSAVEYISAFISARPNMRLVENDRNLGFVRTCNRGFRMARGEYVCLLTNDTEVTRDFVERHLAVMDANPEIGVLSCIIVDPSGCNWFTGGMFRAGMRTNLKDGFAGVREVDWVAGTAPFYRRRVLEQAGYLDEDFVMYHEDLDLCLRLRSRTGYKVCMLGERLVTHHVQAGDSDEIDIDKLNRWCYHGHRNHILLLRKHCPGYLPKLLALDLWDIAYVLAAGAVVVPIIRRRPRASPLALRIAALRAAGVVAGLIARRST